MKKLALTFTLSVLASSALARKIPEGEHASILLEGAREITSLIEIEKLNLISGSSALDLWSGSYWPHYQGGLGVRYREPEFNVLIEKKDKWDEFKKLKDSAPLYSLAGRENNLSPAEKYDLLVGDTDLSLTSYSWQLGEKAQTPIGVPQWRGICDGWASASQKMPRPTKSVTLKSPEGMPITFYPEDIKALGSLLYARAQQNVMFVGKRCFSRALFFTSACDETNPATFHKALVNRVGSLKKSFIADVSPGSEVWNYPVKNYSIVYYNVFSGEESKNFREVLELVTEGKRFARQMHRHESAYAIVGVKVKVNYTDMRPAHTMATDSSEQDKLMELEYNYDLELDRSMNIIGGETFSKNLPDFIWAAGDRTYPLTEVERRSSLSSQMEITRAAKTSSMKGQPLSMIVEKLFELSK